MFVVFYSSSPLGYILFTFQLTFSLRTVYGPESAFTICTDRTDRQTVQAPLSDKKRKYSKYPS